MKHDKINIKAKMQLLNNNIVKSDKMGKKERKEHKNLVIWIVDWEEEMQLTGKATNLGVIFCFFNPTNSWRID